MEDINTTPKISNKSLINISKIFENKNTKKLVWQLYFPVALQLFVFTIVALIDSIIISKYVQDGSAIVGLADVTLNLFNSFALIISAGLTVTYTWALAQGKDEYAKSILNNGFKLMIIFSLFVFLASSTLGVLVIDLQSRSNQSIEVVKDAKILLIFKSLAWPFISIHDHIVRIFRVEGKIKKSALIGVMPIILLILFDTLFMVIPNGSLSIWGASASFVLAYGMTLIFVVPYIFNLKKLRKTEMFPSLSTSKLNIGQTKEIFTFGFPVFWRRLVFILAFIFTTTMVNNISLPWDSSHPDFNPEYWTIILGPAIKLLGLMLSISLAANQGCTALIAYLHKTGDKKRIKEVLKWMWIYATLVTIIVGVVILSLNQQILFLYGITPSKDQSLIFILVIILGIPYPIQLVSFSFFLNTGRVRQSFIITSLKGFVIYPLIGLPLFFVFKDFPIFAVSFIIMEIIYGILTGLFLGYYLSSEEFKNKLGSSRWKKYKSKKQSVKQKIE